jgi:hypothetical protein
MSEDARDSLKLWAGGIAVGLVVWVIARFDLLDRLDQRVSGDRSWPALGFMLLWNLGWFGWGLWRQRASRTR